MTTMTNNLSPNGQIILDELNLDAGCYHLFVEVDDQQMYRIIDKNTGDGSWDDPLMMLIAAHTALATVPGEVIIAPVVGGQGDVHVTAARVDNLLEMAYRQPAGQPQA